MFVSNNTRVSTGDKPHYDGRPDKLACDTGAGQSTIRKKREAVRNYVVTCLLGLEATIWANESAHQFNVHEQKFVLILIFVQLIN